MNNGQSKKIIETITKSRSGPIWNSRRLEKWAVEQFGRKSDKRLTHSELLSINPDDIENRALLVCALIRAGSPRSIQVEDINLLTAGLRKVGRHMLLAELLLQVTMLDKSAAQANAVCDYLFSIQDLDRYDLVIDQATLNPEDALFHRTTAKLARSHCDPFSLMRDLSVSITARLLFHRRPLLEYLSEKFNSPERLVDLYLDAISKYQCSFELISYLQKFIIRKRLESSYVYRLDSVVRVKYPAAFASGDYNLWRESYFVRNPSFRAEDEVKSPGALSAEAAEHLRTHVAWLGDPFSVGDLESFEIYRSAAIKGEALLGCIVLSGSVWGDSVYTDGLFDYGLASLACSGELRRLRAFGVVVVSIHTTNESALRIIDRVKDLEDREGINFRIVTTLGKDDRGALRERARSYMLGLADAAKYQHTYVGLCPDGVYGEGLSQLVGRLCEGKAAFGTLVRISKRKFVSRFGRNIRSLFSLSTGSLNDRLLELGLGVMPHEVMIFYIQNRLPGIRYELDPEKGCFAQSAWMNLWALRPTAEMLREMLRISGPRYNNAYLEHLVQPLDHELAHLLHTQGRLITPSAYDEFVFLELTEDQGYSNVSKGLEVPISKDFFDVQSLKVTIAPKHHHLIRSLKRVSL